MPHRPAFFMDVAACTGCKTCMVACMDKHDLPAGVRWRRVIEYCGGGWTLRADGTCAQDVFAYFLSVACNHCENPVCVRVCPTGAMHKDAAGIVSVDQDMCQGCRTCERACPYGAPQYVAAVNRMSKCDLCRDLLEQGRPPACVAACPTRALDFGEYAELAARYGEVSEIAPLPRARITRPNLILAPGPARPAGAKDGGIGNPEEL